MLSNYKLVPVLVANLLDIEYQSKFCKILKKLVLLLCTQLLQSVSKKSANKLLVEAGANAAVVVSMARSYFFLLSPFNTNTQICEEIYYYSFTRD